MILYLDTSALVKLYVEEEYSEWVHAHAGEAEIIATSVVALPEALSALSRKRREQLLPEDTFFSVRDALMAEWEDFAVAAVEEYLAGDLAVRHPLRGFDAVHLSAAMQFLRNADEVQDEFLSFDKQLNTAAAKEGLQVVAPEDFFPEARS